MAEQRLIDSNELCKVKFHSLPYTHIVPTDANAESYKRGWNDAIDAIMSDAPTIEERKKGKWIEITDHETPVVCKCTECGWLTTHYDSFSFCPNCGADMRKQP